MKRTSLTSLMVLLALGLAACDHHAKTSAAPSTSTSTTVTTTTPATSAQTADNSSPSTPATTTATSSAPPASTDTTTTGSASVNVVNDTMVTGKVKTAIAADNGMKDSDISVKTENGVVTLSGSVKSPEQVTLAAALAQRQEGVNRVENQVAVK